jgi:hypothetical protein
MIHIDIKQLTQNKVSHRLRQAIIMMGIILIGIIISISTSANENETTASMNNACQNKTLGN